MFYVVLYNVYATDIVCFIWCFIMFTQLTLTRPLITPTMQVSSNRDIDTPRIRRTELPTEPAMPSRAMTPSTTEERGRNRSGPDVDQLVGRVSSPVFARTDLPNGDVGPVFTTEIPDGDGDEDESPVADTDTSDGSNGSSDPSSRADQSSLDREVAAVEDDDNDYDTDLESEEGKSVLTMSSQTGLL